MKNVNFKYTYVVNGSTNTLFDPQTISFKAGGEYWFALDLCDEDKNNNITRAYGVLLNGTNSAKAYSTKAKNHNNPNTLYLVDYAK